MQGTTPAGEVDLVRRRQIVEVFLSAARAGDLDGLLAVLDPEVVLRPDADAIRMGSSAELRGAHAVAEFLRGGARAARPALVAGMPGLAWAPNGRVRGAIVIDIVDGRIVEIGLVANAEHLEQLDVVLLDG